MIRNSDFVEAFSGMGIIGILVRMVLYGETTWKMSAEEMRMTSRTYDMLS